MTYFNNNFQYKICKMVQNMSTPEREHKKQALESKMLDFRTLKGKTLLVYWALLKSGQLMGVREIQRELDFSTPSLAAYHLNKLVELSLIEKSKIGSYIVIRKANIKELRDLIIFRALNRVFALPRFAFYAIILSIMWVGYLFIWLTYEFPFLGITTSFIFVNIISLMAVTFLWYETIDLYKNKPF